MGDASSVSNVVFPTLISPASQCYSPYEGYLDLMSDITDIRLTSQISCSSRSTSVHYRAGQGELALCNPTVTPARVELFAVPSCPV